MPISKIKQGSIGQSAVTSDNIVDGTIVNADISPSAAIADAKVPGIGTLCATATSINATVGAVEQNIALLGFKMAVNDGLTVFNLVDGVVDEFHDESGTDESEGSNDYYCATSDFYQNITFSPFSFSAGFTTTTITEPDTSTTGTNPAVGIGTKGVFTVPTGVTSVNIQAWGAGGGGGGHSPAGAAGDGGGGGYVEGTLAVTAGQTLGIFTAEGGEVGWTGSGGGAGGLWGNHPTQRSGYDRGGGNDGQSGGYGGGGGGAGFVTTQTTMGSQGSLFSVPTSAVIASGGGGGGNYPGGVRDGGAGGGATGDAGASTSEQTSANGASGGGGSQTTGGADGIGDGREGQSGGLLYGGDSHFCGGVGGGGGGYYGGGGASYGGQSGHLAGGGGSSYFGHPQITSGSTEEGDGNENGGVSQPNYQADTGEGIQSPTGADGEDGFILLTGSGCTSSTASTTLISTTFSAGSVPTSSRIVVFEENVATPTLNTDIIASISRDGGSTFTNATLTDSGYVTGSSGQRILTGQATISGQPSGQSMRWKLALANNTVKIHGVALQWS